MAKNIFIKLIKASIKSGPFSITTNTGIVLDNNLSRKDIIDGVSFSVENNVISIRIKSLGKCKTERVFTIGTIIPSQIAAASYSPSKKACLWTHLKTIKLYNNYYGIIEPYIIEYPFSYQFQDQILQNVKDYTKAYKYDLNNDFAFDENDKIETNDKWFNKAVLYNGQQSSGILELFPKQLNNLSAYLQYPKFNKSSKSIVFTKSDNFYQYNTFWNVVKNREVPLFLKTCESISIDKVVNQDNMEYGSRSFKKDPIRAKGLKIRHILDNSSEVKLVSQFIITPSQISHT